MIFRPGKKWAYSDGADGPFYRSVICPLFLDRVSQVTPLSARKLLLRVGLSGLTLLLIGLEKAWLRRRER